MSTPNMYPPQSIRALGNHYVRHVDAMTGEGLHSKSAIAEQLAWRDQRIEALEAQVKALQADADRLNSGEIMTFERDEFGEEYLCHRRGLDLRAAIDAAVESSAKIGAPSKGVK